MGLVNLHVYKNPVFNPNMYNGANILYPSTSVLQSGDLNIPPTQETSY